MHTQVWIIGAGRAGLLLARLLHLQGITSVVLELRSRDYVENRVRAGLLEQGSVDVMTEAGDGERLQRECMPHDGVEFIFEASAAVLICRSSSGSASISTVSRNP